VKYGSATSEAPVRAVGNGEHVVSGPLSDHDAAELVQRMASGEERAILRLYDEYGPRLFGLALALLGERADAEEVVLDTYMQAWRSAGTLDLARGTVRSWLTTIARSRALDYRRNRSRRDMAYERASAEALVGSDPSTVHSSHVMAQQDLQKQITFALQQLPSEQREVIELSFLGEASHASVARKLGLPLGTVKTRARLALRKMRATMAVARS
jgi:RNA polymerase sigma-70 factor, ECF subfamily